MQGPAGRQALACSHIHCQLQAGQPEALQHSCWPAALRRCQVGLSWRLPASCDAGRQALGEQRVGQGGWHRRRCAGGGPRSWGACQLARVPRQVSAGSAGRPARASRRPPWPWIRGCRFAGAARRRGRWCREQPRWAPGGLPCRNAMRAPVGSDPLAAENCARLPSLLPRAARPSEQPCSRHLGAPAQGGEQPARPVAA